MGKDYWRWISAWLVTVLGASSGDDRRRGDVPGWVLVTLMTAGLVAAIWAVASPALVNLFNQAISSVTGP